MPQSASAVEAERDGRGIAEAIERAADRGRIRVAAPGRIVLS